MSETYLLDTNIFITAANNYYAFDLAPPFWKQLEELLHSGVFYIIDEVYKEIDKGKDDLAEWLKSILDIKKSLRSDDPEVISAYRFI